MVQMSTRTAFFCVMVSGLLFYNYYSASVVSVRLNEPIFKISDSLTELSKLNFKFAAEWVVYFEYIIKVRIRHLLIWISCSMVRFYCRRQITKRKRSTIRLGKIYPKSISLWVLLKGWSWLEEEDLPITRTQMLATLWSLVTLPTEKPARSVRFIYCIRSCAVMQLVTTAHSRNSSELGN